MTVGKNGLIMLGLLFFLAFKTLFCKQLLERTRGRHCFYFTTPPLCAGSDVEAKNTCSLVVMFSFTQAEAHFNIDAVALWGLTQVSKLSDLKWKWLESPLSSWVSALMHLFIYKWVNVALFCMQLIFSIWKSFLTKVIIWILRLHLCHTCVKRHQPWGLNVWAQNWDKSKTWYISKDNYLQRSLRENDKGGSNSSSE